MKKKYIIFMVFSILVIGLGIAICINNFYKIEERIFGIDASEYEIIEEENALRPFSYNGSYSLVLKIKEDEIEQFTEIIKKHGFNLPENYCDEIEEATEMEEMHAGILERHFNVQIDEDWHVYDRMGSPKWRAISFLTPKTQCDYVGISSLEDGFYTVYLLY